MKEYQIDSNKIDKDFILFYLTAKKPITFEEETNHINKYIELSLIEKTK